MALSPTVTRTSTSDPSTSTPTTPTANVTIIYGPPDEPDSEVISQKTLAKIPRDILQQVIRQIGGEVAEFHSSKIVRPNNDLSTYLVLDRLQKFLDTGDYYPHKPVVPLQVQAGNKIVDWTTRLAPFAVPVDAVNLYESGSEVVKTHDKTYELFYGEVALYKFATDVQYRELRDFSSRRIYSGVYPIYMRELLALLDLAYESAVRSQDRNLVRFIAETFQQHQDRITTSPEFPALLRHRVENDPIASMLLDAYIAKTETDTLLSKVVLKREPSETGEIATTGSTMTTVPPASAPQSPAAMRNASVDAGSNGLRVLVNAVRSGRLMVAIRDGYGTLVNNQNPNQTVRNRDFRFVEGELLVADVDERSLNGRLNVMVQNAKGMRGDVLHTLLKTVPLDMGAVRGVVVNTGLDSKPWRDPFDAREDRPDREERTSTIHSSTKRSRSRSPHRSRSPPSA